jgi:hypothetical protein
VVFDALQLRHAPVQRKVLVKAFELHGELPLLVAPSPVAVAFQPFIRAVQKLPAAFL